MGKQRFHFTVAFNGVLGIKDSAGIFHAAKDRFGLHIGQLAIGIRTNVLNKEGKYFAGKGIVIKTLVFVFGVYPAGYRYMVHLAGSVNGKISNAYYHYL